LQKSNNLVAICFGEIGHSHAYQFEDSDGQQNIEVYKVPISGAYQK
jgi:hypothetical protein